MRSELCNESRSELYSELCSELCSELVKRESRGEAYVNVLTSDSAGSKQRPIDGA